MAAAPGATTLTTLRNQALAVPSAIVANPKPTCRIAGQCVADGDYLKQLSDAVDWCEQRLAAVAPFKDVRRTGAVNSRQVRKTRKPGTAGVVAASAAAMTPPNCVR